jgi:hypothetical protein
MWWFLIAMLGTAHSSPHSYGSHHGSYGGSYGGSYDASYVETTAPTDTPTEKPTESTSSYVTFELTFLNQTQSSLQADVQHYKDAIAATVPGIDATSVTIYVEKEAAVDAASHLRRLTTNTVMDVTIFTSSPEETAAIDLSISSDGFSNGLRDHLKAAGIFVEFTFTYISAGGHQGAVDPVGDDHVDDAKIGKISGYVILGCLFVGISLFLFNRFEARKAVTLSTPAPSTPGEANEEAAKPRTNPVSTTESAYDSIGFVAEDTPPKSAKTPTKPAPASKANTASKMKTPTKTPTSRTSQRKTPPRTSTGTPPRAKRLPPTV